ncbi:MAG: hypothetical protein WAT78_01330 [Rhizobiaceae bacterium]
MKALLIAALMLAPLAFTAPAFATDARQAIKLCDKNPNCSYNVRDNGSVTIVVADGAGGKHISCPQEGECSCDLCRVNPKQGKRAVFGGKVNSVLKAQ